jgi:hypothetical protein
LKYLRDAYPLFAEKVLEFGTSPQFTDFQPPMTFVDGTCLPPFSAVGRANIFLFYLVSSPLYGRLPNILVQITLLYHPYLSLLDLLLSNAIVTLGEQFCFRRPPLLMIEESHSVEVSSHPRIFRTPCLLPNAQFA